MEIFNSFDRSTDAQLPPGYRFHPTDEELITYYLMKKVLDSNFTGRAIAEVDLNKCEPWELPKKAKMGEKEWYFFSLRDRKYPTGLRTNRATEAGYWKATGKDREIYSSRMGMVVGMKKTLVFYKGRAPRGEKSNWVMHEYRLEGKLSYHSLSRSSKDEWVICRIFQKSSNAVSGGGKKVARLQVGSTAYNADVGSPSYSSLPQLLDSSSTYGTSAVTADRESCSYEGESAKDHHVHCFSTAATTGGGFQQQAFVPSSIVANPPSLAMMMMMARHGRAAGSLPLFSLQDNNLQLPFFFSSMPPAAEERNETESIGGKWAELEQQKAEKSRQQQLQQIGSTDLDCLWNN